MAQGVDLWCANGGFIVPFSRSQEREIVAFVDKCAQHGVTRLFAAALMPDGFPRLNNVDDADYSGPALTTGDYYARWEPLAVLVSAARQRGIEVHPYWALCRRGGGADVAWSLDHVHPGLDAQEARIVAEGHHPINSHISINTTVSKFANDHREYWKRARDGRDSFQVGGTVILSPAFADVRAYEIDACMKIMDRSGGAGLQIEFVLEPTDERGVIIYGYEEPALSAFQESYGGSAHDLPNDDRDWMQFRADYVTTYLAELRAQLHQKVPGAPLTATIIAGDMSDYLKVFQDWPAWVEQGLLDGLYLWFRTTSDLEAVARQCREAADVIGGRCTITAQLSCYHPGSFQSPEMLLEAACRAKANGADALGVYRSHAVEQLGLWPVVQQIARL